jgi:hypothetical protein
MKKAARKSKVFSPEKSIVKILLKKYKILTDRRNRFAFP